MSCAWSEAPKQPRAGAEWGEAGECLRGREPPSHSAPDFVEASRAPQAELLNLHPARKSVRSRFFFHVVTTRSCGGCDLAARGRRRAPALPRGPCLLSLRCSGLALLGTEVLQQAGCGGSVLGGAAGCSSGIGVVRPDSFLRFGADFWLLLSIFGGRAMRGVLGAVCSPACLSLYLPICVGVLQTHLPDVKTR